MQPHQHLLAYRKPIPLRMLVSLSSSFFSSSPNPNPNLTFHRLTMNSTSESTLTTKNNNNQIPNFPFFSNPKITLTNSKFFSTPSATNNDTMSSPIPISKITGNGEVGLEQPPPPPLVVVSFYKFASFPDHAELRKPLKELCEQLRVSGGIILAPEGINGSICGIRDSVEQILNFIQMDNRLQGLRRIESPVSPEEEAIHLHGHSSSSPLASGEDTPFRWDHVRVKLKKEIVTLGMPSVSPNDRVGKYVNPKDWNTLITDPNTVVVDVRNDYETRIGKFKGAIDPCTTAFRKFPSWVEERFNYIDSEEKKLPRVAMYCTGGIRCEKATSYLMSKGFEEVYHLEGGILKYLEEVPKSESLWEGECFVFDKRVSVEHGLTQGTYKICYGCKKPISDEDMESKEWEYAVSCPYCYDTKSEEEKERARSRQKQFEKWGIIGGPDKGRKSVVKQSSEKKQSLNNSV